MTYLMKASEVFLSHEDTRYHDGRLVNKSLDMAFEDRCLWICDSEPCRFDVPMSRNHYLLAETMFREFRDAEIGSCRIRQACPHCQAEREIVLKNVTRSDVRAFTDNVWFCDRKACQDYKEKSMAFGVDYV